MQIQFNYRYLKDEIEHETHQYNFTNSIEQRLAYQLQDVGDVVNFAVLNTICKVILMCFMFYFIL